DVERFDLDLLQDLGSGGGGGLVSAEEEGPRRQGVRFAVEALERPGAAFLDLVRDGGKGDDPAEARDVARIGKAGQVMFHPIVPGNQGGGAFEADGSVGS